MAAGVSALLGQPTDGRVRLDWEDRRLVWAVRESFVSKSSQANLVAGLLEEGQELIVESLMPSGGVIFSDGVEADFLPFTSGTIARIHAAQQARGWWWDSVLACIPLPCREKSFPQTLSLAGRGAFLNPSPS